MEEGDGRFGVDWAGLTTNCANTPTDVSLG